MPSDPTLILRWSFGSPSMVLGGPGGPGGWVCTRHNANAPGCGPDAPGGFPTFGTSIYLSGDAGAAAVELSHIYLPPRTTGTTEDYWRTTDGPPGDQRAGAVVG